MKKTELKKILKPLVKECVRKAILEEGVLSGIISEVARGIGVASVPPTVEAPVPPNPLTERLKNNAFSSAQSTKLKEHKNKLMSAIGADSYNGVNLFEGTTPTAGEASPTQAAGALSGQPPGDPGVNIDGLLGAVGNHWGAHMKDKK